MRVEDPVYGKVNIEDEPLVKIIKHPVFERLLQINVIPFPNPYFPGAIDNKEYDHAIGVMHLVNMAEEIHSDEIKEFSFTLKLASLLHYMIDRPIEEPSQKVERLLGIDVEKERFESVIYDTSIKYIIKRYNIEEAVKKAIEVNLSNFNEHQGIKVLFNSIIGLKKVDFLLRDAYYTNQKYVNELVKPKKIISSLKLNRDKGAFLKVPIESCVEKFFAAYNIMFRDVYLHREKNIIDSMYEAVYSYLLTKEIICPHKMLEEKRDKLPLFFTLNDDNILNFFEEKAIQINNKELLHLIKKIEQRDFYNTIASVKISLKESAYLLRSPNAIKTMQRSIMAILKIKNEFAVILSIPMGEVIIESMKKSNKNVFYGNVPVMDSDILQIIRIKKTWEKMQYLNVFVDEDVVSINEQKEEEIKDYLKIIQKDERIYD